MLVRVTIAILGGQEGTAERGEHVGDRDGLLGAVPGCEGAVGGQILGGVGVPADRQAQAHQPEGDQALHGAASAGTGLADAGQVAGVKERLLC